MSASASFSGLTTRFSVVLERMKSTVELYCSTNFLTASLTFALSVAGSLTETVTDSPVGVSDLSVSCTPGIAPVTTFEAEVWVGPPSTLNSASAPCLSTPPESVVPSAELTEVRP